MDFNRNVDKLSDFPAGVSFNQCLDISCDTGVYTDLFSLAQAKLYMKIDTTEDDTLIPLIANAAMNMCEKYVGMNFTPRTVIATINNLNGGTYLPYGPVGAITTVKDIDDNTIGTDSYKITGVQFKQIQWPTEDYLVITYTGGYTTCPDDLIQAVKAQLLFLYENRGDASVGMSPLAALILNPLKRL